MRIISFENKRRKYDVRYYFINAQQNNVLLYQLPDK